MDGDGKGLEVGDTPFYLRSRRGDNHFLVSRWIKLTACRYIASCIIPSASVTVCSSRDTP